MLQICIKVKQMFVFCCLITQTKGLIVMGLFPFMCVWFRPLWLSSFSLKINLNQMHFSVK